MKITALRTYLLTGALAAAVGAPCFADPVYKSVDKDGNTSYSSKPPATPAEKAKTKELSIDPNQNIVPATPVQQPISTPTYGSAQSQEANSADVRRQRIAAAEANLQAAEHALTDGQAVQPGDYTGRKDGGVGPSVQRTSRINELQAAVEQARQALENARNARD